MRVWLLGLLSILALVLGCGESGTAVADTNMEPEADVSVDGSNTSDGAATLDSAGDTPGDTDKTDASTPAKDAASDTVIDEVSDTFVDAEVSEDAPAGDEDTEIDTAPEDALPQDVGVEDTYVPPDYDCGDETLYVLAPVGAWRVCLSKELQAAPEELSDKVLQHLTGDLEKIESVLPPSVTGKLQEVRIWLELDKDLAPGGVYHPSAGWLVNNGYPEYWAKGVQLGNAKNYLDWTNIQPAMVLHELSHAWHHQVLGYGQAEIKSAFEAAMAAGIYEDVAYVGGGTQKAYATTDHKEYFAELTEAFYWVNDFYPFNKEELEIYDPQGFQAVVNAWLPVN